MLKFGKGVGRAAVKQALSGKRPTSFSYTGVLKAREIREAMAGIRDAGTPRWAQPLLAWFASHPKAPEGVLRELLEHGEKGVLLSLALNPNLPADMKRALLRHADPEVRDHANQVFSRSNRH